MAATTRPSETGTIEECECVLEICACGAARAILAESFASTWHACEMCSSAVRAGECEIVL